MSIIQHVSYLPLIPQTRPCGPSELTPTPWPSDCRDSRTEAPSSSHWYFLIHGSTMGELGGSHYNILYCTKYHLPRCVLNSGLLAMNFNHTRNKIAMRTLFSFFISKTSISKTTSGHNTPLKPSFFSYEASFTQANFCFYLRHFNVVCGSYGCFFIVARIEFECCRQHHD